MRDKGEESQPHLVSIYLTPSREILQFGANCFITDLLILQGKQIQLPDLWDGRFQ
jgi:hypothetical protein